MFNFEESLLDLKDDSYRLFPFQCAQHTRSSSSSISSRWKFSLRINGSQHTAKTTHSVFILYGDQKR
eukprot:IDg16048t1